MSDIIQDAHAVLFPVLLDVALDDNILRFLDSGGRSLLFGETGEEYVSGRMSAHRLTTETADVWTRIAGEASARASSVILALDADISAVHRLQGVTPALPDLEDAQNMPEAELEQIVEGVARAARQLGISMFLSPTSDVAAEDNIWLGGRTLGTDLATVERLVGAYVRGCRRGGILSALKHFPGNSRLEGLPGRDANAHVPSGWDALQAWLLPFKAGINAGADAVMMSPANYDALARPVAGSLSPDLYGLLRGACAFEGLAMTCDLDHPATMQDRSIEAAAVEALVAGGDLLLLSAAGAKRIPEIAGAIASAVNTSSLDRGRLADAARRVRAAADTRLA